MNPLNPSPPNYFQNSYLNQNYNNLDNRTIVANTQNDNMSSVINRSTKYNSLHSYKNNKERNSMAKSFY